MIVELSTQGINLKAVSLEYVGFCENGACGDTGAESLMARRAEGVRSVSRIRRLIQRAVTGSSNHVSLPVGIDERDQRILDLVDGRTMTSPIRLLNAMIAARYVAKNRISGGIVECGVWRGGSCMAMAAALVAEGHVDYDFFLFDTFTGMTAPSPRDTRIQDGHAATQLNWEATSEVRQTVPFVSDVAAYASKEDVLEGMESVGYPMNRIHLVEGDVLETFSGGAPQEIALLRLDTDWYESTKHELEIGWPRLTRGGVMIIDDFDFWSGSRQATEEYFQDQSVHPLLMRMDEGRVVLKS